MTLFIHYKPSPFLTKKIDYYTNLSFKKKNILKSNQKSDKTPKFDKQNKKILIVAKERKK